MKTQNDSHDKTSRERLFTEGESVYVRNYRRGEKWLPGCIVQVSGPMSFRVKLLSGKTVKCHVNQMRK